MVQRSRLRKGIDSRSQEECRLVSLSLSGTFPGQRERKKERKNKLKFSIQELEKRHLHG